MAKNKRYDREDGAMEVFMDALLNGDVGNAIERQEARGQKQFVNSSKLPIKFNGGNRKQFEAFGIVYHENVDDLFVNVTLPEDWKLESTSHSMWNKLVDAQGRERASIFYKAAFYDRDSFISITKRYNFKINPTCGWESDEYHSDWREWYVAVTDGGKEIWRTAVFNGDYRDASDKLNPEAKVWIESNYPNWEDATAYWD